MVNISKLRFGSHLRHKGETYFVTNIGVRVIKARKIYKGSKSNEYPNGQLSPAITTIKVKDLR